MLINRVKELRARFNLTQGELAERVGVTRQTIVSLEKGSYTPSLLLAMISCRRIENANRGNFFKGGEKMKIYITIFLRIMLFVSLAFLVFDYLRVEQLFIQMERWVY